jgi:transposase
MDKNSSETFTLGIDISKSKFDAALLRNGKLKHKKFANTPKGFSALKQWLSVLKVEAVHACMESTNVYGEPLGEYLFDEGYDVSIVNPSRIKSFGQSELLRAKTDKADAGCIARFCLAMSPSLWQPDPLEIRQLRALVRRLEALTQMRQQEVNRLDVAQEILVSDLEEHILYLDNAIKETKDQINRHIDKSPDLKNKKRLLESIPGVGEATISVVLSEFANINKFKSAKALACYIGLAPRLRQSGSSVRGRTVMSKAGRSHLRKIFFMPALVALRYNPILADLKQRLTTYGKAKMAIVGAAMRKLVHIIYGVLKNEMPFDANFALK